MSTAAARNNKKGLKLTDHAKIRIIQRGILEEDIQMIIDNPINTVYDDYEENFKSYGVVDEKYNIKKYMIVVHNGLNSNPVKIITAMYISKGGLKRWFQ